MSYGDPIWRDDSRPADRRAMALDRLMGMCPLLMRETLRPFVAQAIARATDDEIAALMVDVDSVVASATTGDYQAVIDTAKRYGATDSQVAMFMTTLHGGPSAESQFAGLLPSVGPDNT